MSNAIIVTALFLVLALGGCERHRPGPFERAGSRADEIKENVEEGKPMFHREGSMEKTGEALDEALGTDRKRR